MRTIDDINRYLTIVGKEYEEVSEGVWLLRLGEPGLGLFIRWNPPVVEFLMNICKIPNKNREEFYATLLRWNATDLLHGSYGLDGDSVIMDCALQVENLDFNEFEAAIDSMEIAVTQHLPKIKEFF